MEKEKHITQGQRLLQWIEEFGSITSYEAFREFGITRLSARIYDLRKAGYKVASTTETSINRYGDKVQFARYYLEEDNEEER